ncbi:MAG TPA: citrate synthase family protein [Blastocatellia bacterium]|jgi:citrate synthase|nr:citrate synthase family protein [Blastocatellia bacterium]
MAKVRTKTAQDRYLTAREAAAALGVSLPTLYSYVSRGMLRSEQVAGNPRVKRYLGEDVARLVERKEVRSDPAKAAARSLHWGSPVLDSSLTLIDGGRIFYRGRDALELARQASVEDVAALLWRGDLKEAGLLFTRSSEELPRGIKDLLERTSHLGPIERCQLALPLGASIDPAAYDLRPMAVARTGARILSLLVSAVCGAAASGPVDVSLQKAWSPRRKTAAPALRAALILCADHELNVSTFTARCIASARATPYEVVIGALAALKGRRHGGHTAEVESLFRETVRARRPREILANRLRQGEGLPGFGHPLYPNGDPRAAILLSFAKTLGRGAVFELAGSLVEAALSLTGEHPTLDFALVTLANALGLPAESPLALFSLGRTLGWIAHAIEQYADARLIRPRARYIGLTPENLP